MDLTSAVIAGLAGAVVSAFFEWFPGVAGWFAAKSPGYKQLLMILAMVVVSSAVFGLSCADIVVSVACNDVGAKQLAGLLLFAIIGNQSWHSASNKIGKATA